jgi:hypothetical protein
MYNLIISAGSTAWDETYFKLEQNRFLEHSDSAIQQKFGSFDSSVVEELKRLPAIFAYERTGPARVGWLKDIRLRRGEIRISFTFDEAIAPFTTEDLDAHKWEFDINKNETYRTHWAVKDVDLIDAFRESGLGGDQVRGSTVLRRQVDHLLVSHHGGTIIHARPTVFQIPTDGQQSDLVAIMMPFDGTFDAVHIAIEAACRSAGLTSQRADSMWESSTVMQDIFSLIYRAQIVVADFSGRNANVFYETGIAHTLGRPVVPLTQNHEDVPFDLRAHRYLRYLKNGEGLQDLTAKLATRLKTLAGR